jgi:hypothetical protein
MPNVRDATSLSSTLGAGATSSVVYCGHEGFNILLSGTFETSTLTMEVSPTTVAADFKTLVVDAPDGTPADVTFTATEVTGATKAFQHYIYGHGLYYRFKTNSTGVAPVIRVDCCGTGVRVIE